MGIPAGTRLGPYKILSALGAGGQASVYTAIDTGLERTVVVKILSQEQTLKPSSLARFEREAKLASSLDHPNICTIHGLYEVDGIRFIAMQYVEGRNVRQLVNGRPLELVSALLIAIQVADALSAAHARGIIHRDIKASNVMVTASGRAKVLDFGLAKLLEAGDDTSNDPHLTELGVPYGTATYAAPEQAAGKQADQRADIFSTGVLLYEMLAGIWPFNGKSVVEVRYAVLHNTPEPVADKRREDSPVIARLQNILNRAMAKVPEERYQRIEDLRDDLRKALREIDPEASQSISFSDSVPTRMPRSSLVDSKLPRFIRNRATSFLIVGVLVLALAAAGFFLYLNRQHSVIDSLAVLPFANVQGDPNTEYLSDGITESLINSLSQLPAVKVRSRNAVFQYRGKEATPMSVGRDLNVRAILTGRVERQGDEMVITVELIDTQDDTHIWGGRYARKLSDLLTLQEKLSQDITDKLRLRLSGTEQQKLIKNFATSSETYQLYLQGRYYWNKRTEAGLQKGVEYFNQAIQNDGNYAPAYSGLADCYSLLNTYDVRAATESDPKAREAATKALALDETLAEAHASLATVSYRYDWRWAEAEQHFKRALELNPDYATAHQWYSAMLAAEGRFGEAIAEAQRAHELEPFSLTINTVLGRRLYYSRQYEQAANIHRKTLEMDRNFVRGHVELGETLVQLGRFDEAVNEFQQALALDKNSLSALAGLGFAYAVMGNKLKALQVIEQLQVAAKQRYVSPYHLALIYTGLGAHEQALDNLEKAADERYNWLVFIPVEPMFDTLRSEPRFISLVRRIGLSPV